MELWPWYLLIAFEILLIVGVIWLLTVLQQFSKQLKLQTELALSGLQYQGPKLKRFRQTLEQLIAKRLWQPGFQSWQGRLIWWLFAQYVQYDPTGPLKGPLKSHTLNKPTCY